MVYINIFELPLYYISFNRNNLLEKHLTENNFKNINHFKAINGRELDSLELLNNNIITTRSYTDLIYGRNEHSGIPSKGAIGCTLSHMELWKMCIDKNLPFIIIVEDDLIFKKPISNKDMSNIKQSLIKQNGGFISTVYIYNNSKEISKKTRYFFGAHFYIISNSCARKLYNQVLPIDMQVDHYMQNLNMRNIINLEGYCIAEQRNHISTIQET